MHRLKEKKIVDLSDISNLVYNSDLNTKLTTSSAKGELKTKKDTIMNHQTFDSSYFHGKSYFEDDGTQNYFVLQPIYRCFKRIGNSKLISPWQSKKIVW